MKTNYSGTIEFVELLKLFFKGIVHIMKQRKKNLKNYFLILKKSIFEEIYERRALWYIYGRYDFFTAFSKLFNYFFAFKNQHFLGWHLNMCFSIL